MNSYCYIQVSLRRNKAGEQSKARQGKARQGQREFRGAGVRGAGPGQEPDIYIGAETRCRNKILYEEGRKESTDGK